jgi:multicomponent Na+:H+ antiporter subunit D
VSQIGYMVMGLAFFTVAGVAAAVFAMIHHIVVKTTLFLGAGVIEHRGGSCRLTRVGGMVRDAPVLAVLFLVPALSLAGFPPFSGFVSKLALVDAGLAAHEYVIVAVGLVVSLLTLLSMIRIWAGVFWNPAEDPPRDAPPTAPRPTGRLGAPVFMIAPTALLVIGGLAIAVFAGPIYDFAERTAADLLHPAQYIEAVGP